MSLSASQAWEIARLDAHAQNALVRSGEVPPEALVEAAIVRIEQVDPALNAVSYRAFDHARGAVGGVSASAQMGLVPLLLKASLPYPGFPQTSCSRARRDAVGKRAWPLAQAYDGAGLIAVGMSTMPEFGLLCSGEPMLTGVTRNPWDASRTAGGSSTGAAVAVAAGLVPLAHASDAGGSIRLPSANCGVIGFKPSRGWNLRARAPHMIDDLLCSDSLIARSVRDVAWGAQLGRPAEKRRATPPRGRLRIALDLGGMQSAPEGDVAKLVQETAALCAALGHHVEPVAMTIDRAALHAAFLTLMPYLGGDLVDLFSAARPETPIEDLLEPWTIGLGKARDAIPPEAIARCFAAIADGQRAIEAFHADWDVVLSPVTHSKPLPVGAMAPTRPFADLWQTLFDYIDYTPLHNMLGTPSISLPLGMTADGLPVGSLFSAAAGQDDLLLELAAEIEAAAPWVDRWPSCASVIPAS